MKVTFVFFAGLGLGVLCGWAGATMGSSPAPIPAAAQAESRPARGSGTADSHAPPEGPEARQARPPKPEKTDSKPIVKTFHAGEESPEMKAFAEKMKLIHQEKRARKIDERLAALKERLGLTDAQAAKVKEILENSEEGGGDAANILAGSGTLDVAKLLNGEDKDERSATDTKLAGLLSPEQQAKFETFQREQRENRIEIATNREMTRLQQGLTLSTEQKDRAYQVLGELAQREDDQPATKGVDVQAMMAKQNARREALRPILSPEQMKVYESMPTQSLSDGGGVSIQLSSGKDD